MTTNKERLAICRAEVLHDVEVLSRLSEVLRNIGQEMNDRTGTTRHQLEGIYHDIALSLQRLSDWTRYEVFCLTTNWHEVSIGDKCLSEEADKQAKADTPEESAA